MEPIIHDGNYRQFCDPWQGPDGEHRAKGLVPRNYDTHPVGCYKSAPSFEAIDFPLFPRSDWSAMIKEGEAQKSFLSRIMRDKQVPCLDQNGRGYCWAHSTVGCVQALRAVANQPTVGLSAYAVACVIKQYRDEGGWGAQSLDFIQERGVPSEEFWPQRSVERSCDKPETWANAALHKVTEGWIDLQAAQYDRKLTFDQVMTLLLCRIPVVGDFNWWSHSVMLVDPVDGVSKRSIMRADSGKLLTLVEFDLIWGVDSEAGGFGVKLRNSWGKTWGDDGFGDLAGAKAIPDGSVAPRVTNAAAA